MPPRLPQVRKHPVGKLRVAFDGHGQQAKVEKTYGGKAVPDHGVPERDPRAAPQKRIVHARQGAQQFLR